MRRPNIANPSVKQRVDDRICRMRRDNMPTPSMHHIARAVGVSRTYVQRVLEAAGLRAAGFTAAPLTNFARILGSAELMAYIAEARERNASDDEMAAHLGCSDDTIQRIRRQIGWVRTAIVTSPQERQSRNDRIRALYEEHDGDLRLVAAALGMQTSAVEHIAHKIGLIAASRAARRAAFGARLAAAAQACGRPPEQAYVDDPRAAERSRLVAPRFVPISRAYVGAQSSAA